MASKKKFEDLNITNEEAKRLTEAFKNEEFRKLFVEYAEEIQDPENRKRYEAELAEMEAQRGMDVKFVHPEPGYVIKTSVDGATKAFINICKNEHVGKPSFEKGVNPKNGQVGQTWSIPHSLAPPRDDFDKSKTKCQVFDVVFHPDTYRMSESNARFRKMVNDTAMSAIERQFAVTLDKSNVKFPKLKFKGTPQATIIRDRKTDGEATDKNGSNEGEEQDLKSEVLGRIPYPYDDKTSREKAEENERKAKERDAKKKSDVKNVDENAPAVPTYTITHRKDMDFQEYTFAPDSRSTTRPKELVVAVDLPLLKSASSVNLDIFEKRLLLESTTPAKYKLDLNLHYKVDEDNGSAKFDKSRKRLTITLPVLDEPTPVAPTGDTNGESDEEGIPDLEDDVPDELNDHPLIEVLSSSENHSFIPEENPHDPETNEEVSNSDEVNHKNVYNSDCHQNGFSYQLPVYTASQDWETTSFVLNVKNAKRDTLKKTFVKNGVQLKMVSVGSGGFPMHYSFMVKFDETNTIETTACDVSISDENVVIVLGKSSESAGLWETFHVGIDDDHLEEALFVTEKTLSSALDQLDVNTMPLNNNDKIPDLEVTQMNDDHLTIQLTNVKEKHHRNKKFSESSDDIEVVHSNGPPQLHSILKDRGRTVSESSDEAFGHRGAYRREDSVSSIFSTGSASEGIVSESEEGATPTRKKSVSFSEHVDQTTYKSNSSVSALHASLKKKNKRYRKKEAKIERRRRRSSGSEHEHSSEEQSSQPDSSEVDGTGNDDDDDVIIDHHPQPLPEESKTELVAEVEDDDENDVATKQASKKSKKNKKKNKGKKAKEVPSEAHAASHAPPETRKSDASEESESTAETVSSPEGERTNVKDDSEVAVNGSGNQSGDTDSKSKSTDPDEAADSDDGEPTFSTEKDKDKERTIEVKKGKDGDAPDSILDWQDGHVDPSDVTKCAFSFSNSMMYELDED